MSSAPIPSPTLLVSDLAIDTANMIKAFIGMNFVTVAYGFSNAGILRGIIGLIVIALITEHCCLLLLNIKKSMYLPMSSDTSADDLDSDIDAADDSDGETISRGLVDIENLRTNHGRSNHTVCARNDPVPSYGDIALYSGGRVAEVVVNAALVVTQFGYCVGYIIFLSQTFHDILSSTLPVQYFVLIPLPILAIIASLRSIRSLGPFSVLANGMFLIGFIAVVTYIAQHFNWAPANVPLSSFPLFFGQLTSSLEGIGLVIPVQASMKNPGQFPFVLRISLLVLTVVLMTVGVMGFATFGADTRSIILLNFGRSPMVVVVKAILIVGILFTYPLQMIPVFEFAERLFFPDTSHPRPSQEPIAQSRPPLPTEFPLSQYSREFHPRRHREERPQPQLSDIHDDTVRGPAAACEDDVASSSVEPNVTGMPDSRRSNRDGNSRGIHSRRDILEESGQYREEDEVRETSIFISDRRVIALRLAIVALTAVVAVIAGASFGLFMAFVGSLGATLLAYTAPALLHYLTFREQLSSVAKMKNIAIVIIGLLGGLLGTITSIWEIVQIHLGKASPT